MANSHDIAAILFDADGVTQFPGSFCQYAIAQYGWAEQTYHAFFHQLFHNDIYVQSLMGSGSFLVALKEILDGFNCTEDPERFMHEWFARNIVINEDLWKHIAQLRRYGVPSYLASNQEKHRAHYMRTALAYSDQFDRLFFSCEIGVTKPSAAYFSHILEATSLEPNRVLFLDDNEPNVNAARGLGIKAEVYRSFEDYLGVLNRYNIAS